MWIMPPKSPDLLATSNQGLDYAQGDTLIKRVQDAYHNNRVLSLRGINPGANPENKKALIDFAHIKMTKDAQDVLYLYQNDGWNFIGLPKKKQPVKPVVALPAAQLSPDALQTRIEDAKRKRTVLNLERMDLSHFVDLSPDKKDDLNFFNLKLNQSSLKELIKFGYGEKLKDAEFVDLFFSESEHFELIASVTLTKKQYDLLKIKDEQNHFVSIADTLTGSTFNDFYDKHRNVNLENVIVTADINRDDDSIIALTATEFSTLIARKVKFFKRINLTGTLNGEHVFCTENDVALEEVDLTKALISDDFLDQICKRSAEKRNIKKVKITPKQLIDYIEHKERKSERVNLTYNLFYVAGMESDDTLTSDEFQKLRAYGALCFEKINIVSTKLRTSQESEAPAFQALSLESAGSAELMPRLNKNKKLLGYKIEDCILTHEEYDALEKMQVDRFFNVSIKPFTQQDEFVEEIIFDLPPATQPHVLENRSVSQRVAELPTSVEIKKFLSEIAEKNRPRFENNKIIGGKLNFGEIIIPGKETSEENRFGELKRLYDLGVREFEGVDIVLNATEMRRIYLHPLPDILLLDCLMSNTQENFKVFIKQNKDDHQASEVLFFFSDENMLKKQIEDLFSEIIAYPKKAEKPKSTLGDLIDLINESIPFENGVVENLLGVNKPIFSKNYQLINIDFSKISADITDADKKSLQNLLLKANLKSTVKMTAELATQLFLTHFELATDEPLILKGIEINGGTLTFAQAKKLYDFGVRKFVDVEFKLEYNANRCAELIVLKDAQFLNNCLINNIDKDNTIRMMHGESVVTLNGKDYSEGERDAELFDIMSGKEIIDLSDKSAVTLNSKALNAFLFTPNFRVSNKIINRITVTDRFDLRHLGNNPLLIQNQIALINKLLLIKFENCTFSCGIQLPDFILKQLSAAGVATVANVCNGFFDSAAFTAILHEAKESLLKIQSQKITMKNRVSENVFLRASITSVKFERLLKTNKIRYFRGFNVMGDVDLSAIKPMRISNLDIQNTLFRGAVNFCNVILSGGKLRGANFTDGIIINRKTDFRGCDLPVSWPPTMRIVFMDNENRVPTTVEALYQKMLAYSKQHKENDFIAKLEKKYPDTQVGQKLFEALRHIQKYETAGWFSKKMQSNRTQLALIDALKKTPMQESLNREDNESNWSDQISVVTSITQQSVVTATSNAMTCEAKTPESPTVSERGIDQLPASVANAIPQPIEEVPDPELIRAEQLRQEQVLAAEKLKQAIVRAKSIIDAALLKFKISDDKEIIAAFLVLQENDKNGVNQYNKQLRENIYPKCLRAIVHSQCDEKYKSFRALLILSGVMLDAEAPDTLNKAEERWAKTSLAYLACATNPDCVNREAVSCVLTKMETRKTVAAENTLIVERQLYIVELIKAKKRDEAKREVAIMKAAWKEQADLPVCSANYSEVSFIDLVNVGIIDQAVLDAIELKNSNVRDKKYQAHSPESADSYMLRNCFVTQRMTYLISLMHKGEFKKAEIELNAFLNGQDLETKQNLLPRITIFLADLQRVETKEDPKFKQLCDFNQSTLKTRFESAKLAVAPLLEKEKHILCGTVAFTNILSPIINAILGNGKIKPEEIAALKICIANKNKTAWTHETVKSKALLEKLMSIKDAKNAYSALAEALLSILKDSIDATNKIKEPHLLSDFTQKEFDLINCAAYGKENANTLLKEVNIKWKVILDNKAIKHTVVDGKISEGLVYVPYIKLKKDKKEKMSVQDSLAEKIYPSDGLHWQGGISEVLCRQVHPDEVAPVNVNYFKYERACVIQEALQRLRDCAPEKLLEQFSKLKTLLDVFYDEITQRQSFDDFGPYLGKMTETINEVKEKWYKQVSSVIAFSEPLQKTVQDVLSREKLLDNLVKSYETKSQEPIVTKVISLDLQEKRDALKSAIQNIFVILFRYGYIMVAELNKRGKCILLKAAEKTDEREAVPFEEKTLKFLSSTDILGVNAFKYHCCYQLQTLRDKINKVINVCPEEKIADVVNLVFTDISDVLNAIEKENWSNKGYFVARNKTYSQAIADATKEFAIQREMLAVMLAPSSVPSVESLVPFNNNSNTFFCRKIIDAAVKNALMSQAEKQIYNSNVEWVIEQSQAALTVFVEQYPDWVTEENKEKRLRNEAALRSDECTVDEFFINAKNVVSTVAVSFFAAAVRNVNPAKAEAIRLINQVEVNWKERLAAQQAEKMTMTDDKRHSIKNSVAETLNPLFNYVREKVRAINLAKITAKTGATLLKGVLFDADNKPSDEPFALYRSDEKTILEETFNHYDAMNYRFAFDLQDALNTFNSAVDNAHSLIEISMAMVTLSSVLWPQDACHWIYATMMYETNNGFNRLIITASDQLKAMKKVSSLSELASPSQSPIYRSTCVS